MVRKFPNMRITVDSPTFPAPLRRRSRQTLNSIEETASPTKQTFLLSPSPTSTTFCTDSPILRSSLVIPTPYTRISAFSIPTSTAGAYPTPRFYSPNLDSQSYYRASSYANWSMDPTLVEGMPTPQLVVTNMSDILPDDMDLYLDERSQTVRWSVSVAEDQQQQDPASEEEVELGPEMPTTYYPISSKSRGLPGDEYRTLKKAQEKAELNEHFAQPSLPTRTISKSAYQQLDLSKDRRSQISEVKNATRRALGSSFDFTDEGYEHSQRASATSSRDSIGKYEIRDSPQRYIDEFNKKWVEDDLKHEATQYAADRDGSGSWRAHEIMYGDIKSLPSRDTASGHVAQNGPNRRIDSVVEEAPRPQLVSKWSMSTIDLDEEPKKRSLFGRRS
ncbi:hypothetical protein PTT_05979 [Pyrenophora teres f. teres 0-1]|uniref:Uncharacterized protein n=2 Tax=Pyrenophora teres f. teres TaxID=97479 RepID=E3RFA5_PYRTT|nr:hypothetical protein PTT_05979 [Pyrenophora teres f. teres 0-1]